jgi:hypothetical protein
MPTRDKLKDPEQKRRPPSSPVAVLQQTRVSTLLVDRAYTLMELAEQLRPRTLDYWRKTIKWLVSNKPYLDWVDLLVGPVKPSGLRPTVGPKRYDQVLRRSEALYARLSAAIRDVIASPNYFTQGVRPDCTFGEIPRGSAHQLQIDLKNNTLSTSRGMIWQEVTIRRSHLTPGAGNTPHDDDRLIDRVSAIATAKKVSFHAAAFTIVDEIPGAGTTTSRVKRLVGREKPIGA